MLLAHSVEQIRTAEASLAATLPGGELMRRAARGLADELGSVPAGEAVAMLIGPGNNGGDALYAATHLLDRGVHVDLCLLDEANVHRPGLDAACQAGARVIGEPLGHRVVVDALFGIGARPGLSGTAAEWARWASAHADLVIAVDVPSGVGIDSGTAREPFVRAHRTVTFGTYKPALLVDPAASASVAGGAHLATLVDIGLGPHLGRPTLEALDVSDGPLLRSLLSDLFASPADGGSIHKYARGVVGIVAGSEQYAGAAHLCVAGAQAGPAGMLRFVGAESLSARVVDRAPEVVAGRGRVQAWVVGPGSGDSAGDELAWVLEEGMPVVVDASALMHLPERFEAPALLTPHAGELADMLGVSRADVEGDPLWHARAAAERWHATVLLKGARTLVAHPSAPTRVNLTGSPWLATAGAGDVLAGLAGSLLASGLDTREAGSWAAFLHGAASIRVNRGGPVTARAVASAIPATIAALLRGLIDDEDTRDWGDR